MSIYTKRFISTKRPRQQVLDAQNYVHPCPEKCADHISSGPIKFIHERMSSTSSPMIIALHNNSASTKISLA
jgi:hypothetical protein